jgi:hypothetical protein
MRPGRNGTPNENLSAPGDNKKARRDDALSR